MAFTGTTIAGTTVVNSGVEWIHPELTPFLPKYEKIADCIAGEDAVKSRGRQYLPQPNSADTSKENDARYLAYVTRAVFYNVLQTTLSGLVGQVFLVDPIIEVPELLDSVVKDANGNGVPLVQLAQSVEENILAYGRSGLFVDYPVTDGVPTTREQQIKGQVRPTINRYDPWNVINWRTITRGGKILLSLVVLREVYEKSDDGFAFEFDFQYRVLRLVNDRYQQEIWRNGSGTWAADTTMHPVDSKGQPLNEIPFTFVGSVDNSPCVDLPPLYSMAGLNIAHYRNSADYEESVFITGQATPVIAGVDQHWVEKVLMGKVELGSRAAIPLPTGASASLLQMEERSAAFEAMEHKERQMVALGAKLVEQKSVQRTATEAGLDEASETSTLTTATNNTSTAIQWSLEWCGIFVGTTNVATDANTSETDSGAIKFELNTDFDIVALSVEDQRAAIDAWIKEAISFEEMRVKLRQGKLATEDDNKAKASIAAARMDEAKFNEQFPEPTGFGGA